MLAYGVMKRFLIFLTIIIGSFCWGIVTKAQEYVVDEKIPEIYIKAVNPGYRIDGINNVGEMIEISRRDSDAPISLAGLTVGYTNSSGNEFVLFEFPENSLMAGETILLRLASSPGHELAAENYKKTLAMSGGITLERDGELLDEVCWTGKEGCFEEFKSSRPTTLVRNIETGLFEHLEEYEPDFDEDSYVVEETIEETAEEPEKLQKKCNGLKFSEILSYYEFSQTEQFVEIFNSNAKQIEMNGCKIRYKSKDYVLNGVIESKGYYKYYSEELKLTKNPTSQNTLELIDLDGEVVDKMSYPKGQKKGTSYALISYDKKGGPIWRITYAPTPGKPNKFQEFRTCEKGKVINRATGNCVKVVETTIKVCEKGQFLNPLTGRCKKLQTKKKKICGKGQYLNPLTGRCKKIQTKKQKTCKKGYYLNPETNRCRKIKENNGADYSLEPENFEESSAFTGLYAVIGVVGAGLLYLIYEFRYEILRLWHKVFRSSR